MDIFKGVIDWIVAQLHVFWVWFVNLIQVPDVPQWLIDGVQYAAIVMDYAGQLGHWVPWPVLVTVAVSVFTVQFLALAWAVGRWIVQVVLSAL